MANRRFGWTLSARRTLLRRGTKEGEERLFFEPAIGCLRRQMAIWFAATVVVIVGGIMLAAKTPLYPIIELGTSCYMSAVFGYLVAFTYLSFSTPELPRTCGRPWRMETDLESFTIGTSTKSRSFLWRDVSSVLRTSALGTSYLFFAFARTKRSIALVTWGLPRPQRNGLWKLILNTMGSTPRTLFPGVEYGRAPGSRVDR